MYRTQCAGAASDTSQTLHTIYGCVRAWRFTEMEKKSIRQARKPIQPWDGESFKRWIL